MKLYKVQISPASNFVTQLRGDTLFGQLCWGIRFQMGNERLEILLKDYASSPFMVVSDPFVPGYLPKPKLPGMLMGESIDTKKENRKRIWMTVEQLQNGAYTEAQTDEEVGNIDTSSIQVHNSLNYKTFNTDGDTFSPYSMQEIQMRDKELYVLLDEDRFNVDELYKVLHFIGEYGYGKESSIGKGRFVLKSVVEVKLPQEGTTYMTLGPSVLQACSASRVWYDTFTRFGKHGASRAPQNAFKRPVLMAETGAVAVFESAQKRSYIGEAVTGVSSAHSDTVHQGYSIVVAIKEIK